MCRLSDGSGAPELHISSRHPITPQALLPVLSKVADYLIECCQWPATLQSGADEFLPEICRGHTELDATASALDQMQHLAALGNFPFLAIQGKTLPPRSTMAPLASHSHPGPSRAFPVWVPPTPSPGTLNDVFPERSCCLEPRVAFLPS